MSETGTSRTRTTPSIYAGADLSDARIKIQNIMGSYFTSSPVETWLGHFAPFASHWNDMHMDTILEGLKKNQFLDEDGWVFMREVQGKDLVEDDIFVWVQDVAKHLTEAARALDPDLSPSTIIQNTHTTSMQSEVKDYPIRHDLQAIFPNNTIPPPERRHSHRLATSGQRPTAYGGDKTLSSDTSSTAMGAEFKLLNNIVNRTDNEQKICGGATELIYNDPTRRFVHGLTIEGSIARFWRFDRCQICVSEDLDYHKNPRPFIRFLLFTIFAPPTQLGFDPTVRRRKITVNNKDVVAYEYRIEDRFFLTQGNPISEDAAYHINSRSTRVWLVREIFFAHPGSEKYKLGEDTYALKDVYLSEDADLEVDIQKKIFDNLRDLDIVNASNGTPTQYYEEAQSYFLEILLDKVVDISWGGGAEQLDITPKIDCHPAVFTGKSQYFFPRSQQTSQRDTEKDSQPDPPTPLIQFRRRKHVRTVFKQHCQSVYELKDGKQFIRCMADITKGLWYLRLAGYVHRDISAGNCLWHAGSGGRIADLEYAKPYNQVSSHDPRMGTPPFMAAEYQRRRYFFLKDIEATSLLDNRFWEQSDSKIQDYPFVFNFYHDLESIFWVCFWFLIYRPPKRLFGSCDEESVKVQLGILGSKYFACGVTGNPDRDSLVQVNREIVSLVELLKQQCNYLACLPLMATISVLVTVKEAHRLLEASDPRNRRLESFDLGTYNKIIKIFERILERLPEGPLPVQNMAISGEGKHSRDGGETEQPRSKKVKHYLAVKEDGP